MKDVAREAGVALGKPLLSVFPSHMPTAEQLWNL